MNDKKLMAKVKAVNAANSYANMLAQNLLGVFRPLVGRKVVKQDGSLLAKYDRLLWPMPSTHSLHVFQTKSAYWLGWTVKTCENIEGGCGCLYHEVQESVGRLDDEVLVDLVLYQERKTTFTVEEVLGLLERARVRKREYEQARADCYPFEE